MLLDTLAKAIVDGIETSQHAPAYYDKRILLISSIANTIVEELDATDRDDFLNLIDGHLNNFRTWKRISEYLELPESIEKSLDYHAIYNAMRKGYVNARKDKEGWLIEEVSFHAWLRAYPYGAYGGNG